MIRFSPGVDSSVSLSQIRHKYTITDPNSIFFTFLKFEFLMALNINIILSVSFEIFTAVTMKNAVVWALGRTDVSVE
jgi:hypothetical protein